MNSSKKKPSLPRLKTSIPLLEQSSNASCNALPSKTIPDASAPPIIMPEKPVRTSTLFKEDKHDEENIVPGTHLALDAMPTYVSQKDVDNSPLTKAKKSYYEDAFTARGSSNSPKDRVIYESVVVVELKTNTKAKEDTAKLLSEFAHSLAKFYQRPETSMLVTIDQNADLIFGTTSGSAYLLKISALSSLIAPLTNVRNTSLIQSTIQHLIGIAPEKGVIIYTPVSEDNLATNGTTARTDIERLGQIDNNSPSLLKSISRSMSRRIKSSSGNSAPLSLTSVMSLDAATASSTSPAAFASSQTPPLRLRQADDQSPIDLSRSLKGAKTPPVPFKDEKGERTLQKRGSLRGYFNRRLGELGELTARKSPAATKGKQD